MHWGWLVPTATVVPAVITLATFMATVPCSPARFWAWRLRRHGAAVAALDPERHANQLEVLQQRTDYLANRVAAAQHIPTPWLRYVIGAFISSYVVALIVILVWQGPGDFPVPGPGAWVFAGWTIVWVTFVALRSTLVYATNNRRERAKFIAEGCPPDFVPRPHLHARIRANEEREREQIARNILARPRATRSHRRAKRMWKNGTMPADWRPRSRDVVRVRQAKWAARRIFLGVQKRPMPALAATEQTGRTRSR
jgi:hypothetical protein